MIVMNTNTNECFVLFLVDTLPPEVICPEDILLTILTGMGGSGISWVEPTVTDNSGNAFLRSQSHTSGQYFEVGITTVTYTYADFSGNTGRCSFLIDVNEGEIYICVFVFDFFLLEFDNNT